VILNPLESLILWLLAIFYTGIMLWLFRYYRKSPLGRENKIAFSFIFSVFLLYALTIVVYFLWNTSPSITDFITIYGLLVVAVYVVAIEVPGFLLISRYDDTSVDLLEEVHRNLILSVASFEPSIPFLEDILQKNKDRLNELHVFENLNYFVISSKEMNPQINKSIFDLLLFDINQTIKKTADSSKHPFPKLIDVLSLAGLSFLIAQLLK
jgi:hypothetical protein